MLIDFAAAGRCGHLFGSNQRGVLVISRSEALRRLIDQLQFEG